MKKREAKYYSEKSEHYIYERDGHKYFILPMCFHVGYKEYYGRPYYEKLGLIFVEEEFSTKEMLFEIPEGWEVYQDNNFGYWEVICNEKDEQVIDIFYKTQFWMVEDYFARYNDDDSIFNDIKGEEYDDYVNRLKPKKKAKVIEKTESFSNLDPNELPF